MEFRTKSALIAVGCVLLLALPFIFFLSVMPWSDEMDIVYQRIEVDGVSCLRVGRGFAEGDKPVVRPIRDGETEYKWEGVSCDWKGRL